MILLDDAQSTAASPTSRLYENPLYYWCILPSGNREEDLATAQHCLQEISTALARGEFVVTAFAIEHAHHYLLSQSPELFIAREGDTLRAMPMKGTASALSAIASTLSDDPKNQAENVMIVDLLRNDLSRISLPGTVSVPHLFEVARHGNVLQMTSTVQGQIKPETTLFDILNAVFPCGSVTGAPKKRGMEIIRKLESEDRGYYCGALGWLDPSGNFAFSVPIRAVEVTRDHHSHTSQFTLGVGAGITNDSDAKQEWQECRIKSAFLMELS
ncbi:chorismate-binding protein [Polynucleobacter necessarius]|uniref:chorismate-binding protein n=1 Tax=Polynucleobacter necessarius TaxID=576610 RepID=UPI0018D57EA8|nr:chorismate-binding protein [Polynucleobacter necessarius]